MATELPLREHQARRATGWLVRHFGPQMRAIIEETPATPFGIDLLCGIVCQETAYAWLPFIDQLTPAQILARSVYDASGDAANTTRSAFPKNTAAFRERYGNAFTDMLIREANETRAQRGMGPKAWVYKGYGIFQYDLQHVANDEAFFRDRLWRDFDECLSRAVAELMAKFATKGELWAAVKAYNGSGARAEQYKENVKIFTAWAKDEIGRQLAGVSTVDPQPASRGKKAKGNMPAGRPRLTAEELRERIASFAVDRTAHPVMVVGIRGYYKDTMGAPGVNDRGIYDDALFVDSPDTFTAFNGNTDPSAYRAGQGTGTKKGMASLNPGLWYAHRFGQHKGKYLALCQRLGQVTVTRDGNPPYLDTGDFGINIHKGGYTTTSSEGCQTIHPDQWNAFISLVTDHAKRYHGARWDRVVIPYVLIDETAA
jgi:hypothetical protein